MLFLFTNVVKSNSYLIWQVNHLELGHHWCCRNGRLTHKVMSLVDMIRVVLHVSFNEMKVMFDLHHLILKFSLKCMFSIIIVNCYRLQWCKYRQCNFSQEYYLYGQNCTSKKLWRFVNIIYTRVERSYAVLFFSWVKIYGYILNIYLHPNFLE